MIRSLIAAILFSACAGFETPDPSNLAVYCTAETGYRVGYQSRAYYGVCPKDTEGAFLAGLERGPPRDRAAKSFRHQGDET